MIFEHMAQNFSSIIDAKVQDPSFNNKGVIQIQSKSGAADRARGNTGL